jgi:ATP-binding cassette subfamily B protein/subfamily B ATP-binding cassette protein MsbA
VAVFWGVNIGALYPIIRVAHEGRPLQQWIDDAIAKSEQKSRELRANIQRRRRALESAPPPAGDIDRGRSALEYDLASEERAAASLRRVRPILYHRWFPRAPFQTVLLVVAALLLATLAKGLFVFINLALVARLHHQLTYDLRRQFFRHALRIDLAGHGREKAGGLLGRFSADLARVAAGVQSLFGDALREPMKMLTCLVGASLISWRLLAFSLLLTPLTAFLVRQLAGSIKRSTRRALEEVSNLYGVLNESFSGIQTVQAFTLEHLVRRKFRSVSQECLRKLMRISLYKAVTKPLTETLGIGVICLALAAGAYLSVNQQTHIWGIRLCDRPLSLPALLLFYGLLIGAVEPSRKLSDVFNTVQAAIPAADRLFLLLDRQPDIASPPHPRRLARPHRRIVFEGVHFEYTAGHPVLSNINLELLFGETVAIVGPNGSGKTTLTNLIPRFYDPHQGAVLIDGVDLREVHLRSLRKRIGLVTQRTVLFDDTVRNNIRYGRLGAAEADVVRAAQQARAHEFIMQQLELGYDTNLGAGGQRLSGGQRQRIALARALIRDPEILILDEATNQIDFESERLIQQALRQFRGGRTVLVVTHRFSTLQLADRIVVMNNGQIEDVGTRNQLAERCELFRRLYAGQFAESA